jgi:MYXO-CTERM domain-containing protein
MMTARLAILLASVGAALCARSAAPALADSSGTYSALPPSKTLPFLQGQWTFSVNSENSTPSSDWLGLKESQVFLRQLAHQQSGGGWTIKIGKGGQIFSIASPATGEMIALQRISHGQWVDEVLQHTIPSFLHSKSSSPTPIVDGDIHQAGYYTRSDLDPTVQIIPASIYSPVFPSLLEELRQVENGFSLITWPQHAHLPRTYSENGMLMHQLTRDVGDGVVEITIVITKWQGEETRALNLPWSAFRSQSLPATLISAPDGSYARDNQTFGSGVGRRWLKDRDTGGWIAFAQGDKPDSSGIGIVFGREPSVIESGTSYVQWGEYGTSLDGGTVGTVKRDIKLLPGDSVFSRYFVVIGTLAKIQQHGNLLQSRVEVGRLVTSAEQAGLVRICPDAVNKVRRGCTDPGQARFYAFRDFLPDAVPLFLLRDPNAKVNITADPYEVSADPTNGVTEYLDVLGWASRATSQAGSCLDRRPLAEVASGLGLTISSTVSSQQVLSAARFKQDGEACDDRDACTTGETCRAGLCGSPSTVVSCVAADACHEVGKCEPLTGRCSSPAKSDGSPCPGGACLGGSCVLGAGDGGGAAASNGCGCSVRGPGRSGYFAPALLVILLRRRRRPRPRPEAGAEHELTREY